MLEHFLSYSIIDFISISPEVYVNLFSRLNTTLWPGPLLLLLSGIGLLVALLKQWFRCAYLILGFAWLSCAYAFHFRLLSELNWVGYWIAVLFALQGMLFLIVAWLRPEFELRQQKLAVLTLFAISLSLIFFLIVPVFFDRSWQSIEIFALAPNPTCVVSVGVLMTFKFRWQWLLWLIPLLWMSLVLAVLYALR